MIEAENMEIAENLPDEDNAELLVQESGPAAASG